MNRDTEKFFAYSWIIFVLVLACLFVPAFILAILAKVLIVILAATITIQDVITILE